MSLLDDVIEKFGVNYEDLRTSEKETLNSWVEAIRKNQLTVEKIRDYVAQMRAGVEQDISKEPTFIRIFIFKVENPQLIRMQARLRNYILLESFLSTPENAQKQLEQAIEGLKPKA